MFAVHVFVHVKAGCEEAFRAATLPNAAASVREDGCERFDIYQQQDDPRRFVLVEVYHGPDAAASHKATSHYQTWRDAVAEMMAEPRHGIKLTPIAHGAHVVG